MNKAYLELGEKVIVSSDETSMEEREYTDNFKEILESENDIEELEGKIERLNKDLYLARKIKSIGHIVLISLLLEPLFLIISHLSKAIINYNKVYEAMSSLGMLSIFELFINILVDEICKREVLKEKVKKEIIEQQLQQEKEKLLTLKSDKSRENVKVIDTSNVTPIIVDTKKPSENVELIEKVFSVYITNRQTIYQMHKAGYFDSLLFIERNEELVNLTTESNKQKIKTILEEILNTDLRTIKQDKGIARIFKRNTLN